MFKVVAKMKDGTVERWDGVSSSMLRSIRAIYDRPDVFKVSVMAMDG
jgi:hypothetical protein